MRSVKISWGRNPINRLVHISTVNSGLVCQCVCPDCGVKLVANKGDPAKKLHHFSHYSKSECSGESVLHRAAKQIIEDAAGTTLTLFTPMAQGYCKGTSLEGEVLQEFWKVSYKKIKIESAVQESRLGNIVADVLIQTGEGSSMAVEIFVTHFKSDKDSEKFKQLKLNCIEIDLSGCNWDILPEELIEQVLKEAPRRWIHSNAIEKEKNRKHIILMSRLAHSNDEYSNSYKTDYGDGYKYKYKNK